MNFEPSVLSQGQKKRVHHTAPTGHRKVTEGEIYSRAHPTERNGALGWVRTDERDEKVLMKKKREEIGGKCTAAGGELFYSG